MKTMCKERYIVGIFFEFLSLLACLFFLFFFEVLGWLALLIMASGLNLIQWFWMTWSTYLHLVIGSSIIFSRRLTFLFLLDSPTFSSHKSHTTKNIIKEFTSLSILIEIEHVAVIFFYKYLYYFHKIHFEYYVLFQQKFQPQENGDG